MEIIVVEPTVFFVRDGQNHLKQLCHLQIHNPDETTKTTLTVSVNGHRESFQLVVPHGHSQHDAFVPDLESPSLVELYIEINGDTQCHTRLTWLPQRHWEVHLTHYSHHDLGYTDLPSHVLDEHAGILDDTLRFCAETEFWSEAESRFRFQCEHTHTVLYFLKHRPPAVHEQLRHFVQNGQIEITALFGNMLLEFCDSEALIRLLYPAFELKHQWNIPITSANHNDIPGLAWGLASVLAGAGVHYLALGMPAWYFGEGDQRVHPLWDAASTLPVDQPAACWWEGQDGSRVLLWLDPHGREWLPVNYGQAVSELPGLLRDLESNGYPYDMVRFTVRGGHRDNAPATMAYAHIARAWNQHWAYPKLINTTNTPFLHIFERRYGDTLKVLRGDVPGTDYPVSATCTPRETALNRNNHNAFASTETLATLATLVTDAEYPTETLREARQHMMYFDEHCWGMGQPGGPAQDAHWAEKNAHAHRAAALLHDVQIKAANQISDYMTISDDGWHIAVFNTLSHACSDIVRAPLRAWSPCSAPMFWDAPNETALWPSLRPGRAVGRRIMEPPLQAINQPFQLIDCATDNPVPFQLSTLNHPQAAQPWSAERVALAKSDPRYLHEMVFAAEGLPAVGYKTYRLVPCDAWPTAISGATANTDTLESRFFKITQTNGVVTSIWDKELQREFIDPSATHGFAQLLVRWCESGMIEPAQVKSLECLEQGPVFSSWRIKSDSSICPRITTEIVLYEQIKRIDISLRVLKDSTPLTSTFVAFPFTLDAPQFVFEGAGAIIEPLKDQWPGSQTDYYAIQRWLLASDDRGALVWTALDVPMVALSGLWPGYVSAAHHAVAGPNYRHEFLKPGQFTNGHVHFLLSFNNFKTNFINAHAGEFLTRYSLTTAAPTECGRRQARHLGQGVAHPPLAVWIKGAQPGPLPATASFVQFESPTVDMLAFKPAEQGKGYVLRVAEREGIASSARVEFSHFSFDRVNQIDLVEQEIADTPTLKHIDMPLLPWGIATCRLSGR